MVRGKKLDPQGKKLGVQTGRAQTCGKQSDKWGKVASSSKPTKK